MDKKLTINKYVVPMGNEALALESPRWLKCKSSVGQKLNQNVKSLYVGVAYSPYRKL